MGVWSNGSFIVDTFFLEVFTLVFSVYHFKVIIPFCVEIVYIVALASINKEQEGTGI